MSIDLTMAASFLAAHARVIDRRRFEAATAAAGGGDAARRALVGALDGYRNADGGYGWGLEPDLRAPESQPGGAMHALEAVADAWPVPAPQLAGLLDWLDAVTLPDGGLPFALPIADPTACAPFWAQADPTASSLQITAAIAARAYRVGRRDATVLSHPWLRTATRFCFDAIGRIESAPPAYVLSFSLQLLDAASDTLPEARELLARLARHVPSDGAVAVEGGAEGETLHLLDYAPEPGRPVRELLDPAAIARDLDRLEGGQLADGGWAVDYDSYSPVAALDWRGYVTANAVTVLRLNGR